jgi:hypothetical protein
LCIQAATADKHDNEYSCFEFHGFTYKECILI